MINFVKSIPGALKASFVFLIGAALLVPTASAFAVTQSWYGSTFAYNTTLAGSTRYYDGSNVGIEFHAYQNSGRISPSLGVALYRDGWVDDYIGTQYGTCSGFNHFDWSGVGSGNYYFYFNKTTDGLWVYSDDVAMFSW
jgi:hypothetical protein